MAGPAIEARDVSMLRERFRGVRSRTRELAAPLSPEDQQVQSMPDASPTKWHLAHTTWFFEEFVLGPHTSGYRPFHERFGYLFNSYYQQVGPMHPRPRRGLLTRPSLDEVHRFREHVEEAIERSLPALGDDALALIELGCHHEQQHQELLLTDIKHALWCNPLLPAYKKPSPPAREEAPTPGVSRFDAGLYEIGHAGEGFCFDNECPRHTVYLEGFELAPRPVTNREYLAFVDDGGYRTAACWLSDGWQCVSERGWRAPLYWHEVDGAWHEFTLEGTRPLDLDAPVTHVSYFEADAFASWAGKRLPTEAEWEVAAAGHPFTGNFVESGRLHPTPLAADATGLFGDVWEWTSSAYSPYPGFRAPEGAVGEYNGKFMCGQLVLRGGSCATSADHVRASYRNFFHPDARWQFSGVRLAES